MQDKLVEINREALWLIGDRENDWDYSSVHSRTDPQVPKQEQQLLF